MFFWHNWIHFIKRCSYFDSNFTAVWSQTVQLTIGQNLLKWLMDRCQPGHRLLSKPMMIELITETDTNTWFNLVQMMDGYSDVIMSSIASQITGVSIVYLTVCSGADQRKHQSAASLASVRGIHRWPVTSPHKGPVTRKMFPFDDVIVMRNGSADRVTYISQNVRERIYPKWPTRLIFPQH